MARSSGNGARAAAPGGGPSRRGFARAPELAVVVAFALAAATLAGCPARRPDAAASPQEIGPPSVLNPSLLDRG
ncbi:MAG TPA: hypothetical protein VFD92_13640 [Candidatus Binatia bacterium]|nr:hypothetical protein [Candidatus Binatia bacterium]